MKDFLKKLSYFVLTPYQFVIILMIFGLVVSLIGYGKIEIKNLQLFGIVAILVLFNIYTIFNFKNLAIRKLGLISSIKQSALIFKNIFYEKDEENKNNSFIIKNGKNENRIYFKKFLVRDVKHNFASLNDYEVARRLRIFSEAFRMEGIDASLKISKYKGITRFYITLFSNDKIRLIEAIEKITLRLKGIEIYLKEINEDFPLEECTINLPIYPIIKILVFSLIGLVSCFFVINNTIGQLLFIINLSSFISSFICFGISKSFFSETNINISKGYRNGLIKGDVFLREIKEDNTIKIEANKFLVISSFDTTYKRFPLSYVIEKLKDLNNLIHMNFDFDIIIIASPIPKYLLKSKLMKQTDMYYSSWQVGGTISHLSKAIEKRVVIKRMEEREDPYYVNMIAVLKIEGKDLEEVNEKLKGSYEALKSYLNTLGLNLEELKDYDTIRALRLFYLPLKREFGISKIKKVFALTNDYLWFNPLALDRKPILPESGILLGEDDLNNKVYWDPNKLVNAHLTIIGLMGVGKTTLARTISLRGYNEGINSILIIDPNGEYVNIAKELNGIVIDLGNNKVNPLLLSGYSPQDRAEDVVKMCAYAVNLNVYERVILRKAIIDCYLENGIDLNDSNTWKDEIAENITLEKIAKYIKEKMNEFDERRKIIAESLLYKLEPLTIGKFSLNRTDLKIKDLLEKGGVACLTLRSYDEEGKPTPLSIPMQKAIVWGTLEQLYSSLMASGVHEKVRVLVIVDEAHLFVKWEQRDIEPPLSRHLRMLRKFGASYVLITHVPEDFPIFLYKTVGTLIVFGSSDPQYLDFCKKNLDLLPEDIEEMKWFSRGQCYLRVIGDPRPMKITVIPEEKAYTKEIMVME
ncbi:MAG: ATP-binding protein [Candidatus Methanomethylicaceae archaeon]